MKNFLGYTFVTIIVLVGLYVLYYYDNRQVKVKFAGCIDGDTVWINIDNKKEKVRLLAIDAPEIGDDYGEVAKNYLCDKLSNANSINVEYDNNSDVKDKYGRVLAWVFADEENINKSLVSSGYARVRYIYNDYKYVRDLCIEQEEAYKEKIGVWEKDNSYKENYCIKKKIIDNS